MYQMQKIKRFRK